MSTSHPPMADLSPEERRALLAQLLRAKARASVTRMPLSYGQQALYFTQQLAPESSAYNVAFAATVRSAVDALALQRAFQTIVDRHAALRTSFELTDDGPVQCVAGAADLDFALLDLAGYDDAELARQVEAAHAQPFDLACAPLMRVRLFTRHATDHVLLMTVHHIVFDGWSMGLVLDELTRLYAAELGGSAADLAPVQHQYGEFVAWQQQMLAGSDGERLRTYWHGRLAGDLPVLDLPIDKPRPPFQSFHGSSHTLTFAPGLALKLRELAKAEHTTLYALVLAAFYVLLHRSTGQEDLIVGSPMAGRSRPAFQQTVGYFVSPLPLRATLAADDSFRDVLGQVRQILHEAIAHEDYPFALLVEQLHPKREPGRTPIIEVLFTHQKAQILGKLAEGMATGSLRSPEMGLQLEPFPLSQENGQFDLSLLLIEAGDALGAQLKYNSDLFEPATIARMAGHFQMLLDGIIADPGQAIGTLPMLTPEEQSLILAQWNATDAAYPADRCIHELVAAQAARTPEAIAVWADAATLTYGELERRANRLAHHLRTLGVGPGSLVGVLLERTPTMLVALLGVLKAGAAYVPLDPGFPAERLAMMLEDSRAAVLLTQASLVATVSAGSAHLVCLDTDWPPIEALPDEALPSLAGPEDLAYVIFTSGSTGRPKGVQIPHRAVVNFLHSMAREPGLAADDVLLAVTTLSFDIAVLELFLPLLVGARVALASRGDAANGEALASLLVETGASVMQAAPVTWRLLLATDWQPIHGFKGLCGGEALPASLAGELLERGVTLWNMYGPTETTVWSTLQRITSAEPPILIGRPIANTQLYILSPALQPLPVGVTGELYIGGDGLAHGYLHQPALTNERFINSPFSSEPGVRLYYTGDLARYKADGSVEVLGRTDHQVKIRGFRIELGEIEATLVRHPEVAEAAVAARDDGRGGLRLVAYLVPTGTEIPAAGALRVYLRTTLPDYMLPTAFVPLDQLPRTPNGKLDRRALPAPEPTRALANANFQPPSSSTEQAVAEVWREVLQLERVGVYDNFFDLGGHSLLAVETLARLEHRLGVKVGPAVLRMQSLGQIAATYDELLRTTPEPASDKNASAPPPTPPSQGLAGRLFNAVRRVVAPGDADGKGERS
ncbi:non-ribosomal peptide synthetase [Candidatus Chloroploca sp. Khr17]|uniref:non-ribosomal peptide synthetase n=1 Tax=Candidatus Chloroploca sp. Khr17 TaxID=2496869 RepID=UPI00101D3F80|nr:non-ribosomal peptide synthetase [Candidatus Chloroploca sp. Khr17]